jgi:hypothetical protein
MRTKQLEDAEPWTGQSQPSSIGIGGTLPDQQYRGITNPHVHSIAEIFVSSGIGSREDALATIIPPLLQRCKLPDVEDVMETLLLEAKVLRRTGRFESAENLLRWLLNSLPPKFQERAVRSLGEVFRWAVYSPEETDRRIAKSCFDTMVAIDTLSENWPIQLDTIKTIADYKHFLAFFQNSIKPDGRKHSYLMPLFEDLASTPPRP